MTDKNLGADAAKAPETPTLPEPPIGAWSFSEKKMYWDEDVLRIKNDVRMFEKERQEKAEKDSAPAEGDGSPPYDKED